MLNVGNSSKLTLAMVVGKFCKMDMRFFLFYISLLSMNVGAGDIFDYGVPSFDRLSGTDSYSVTDIVEGPDGRIWIGSQRGVFYLDGERLAKPHSLEGRDDKFLYYYVSKIWFDADGDMFVGTRSRGVYHFDQSKGAWSSLIDEVLKGTDEHPLSVATVDFAQAGQGSVWIATENSLCLYTKNDSNLVCKKEVRGQVFNSIKSLYSNKYALYIGTQNGLLALHYDKAAPFPIHRLETLLSNASISSIAGDARPGLWLTSSNMGSFRIEASGEVVALEGSLNAVDIVLHKKEVWMATENQGIQVFNYESRTLSKEYRHELENPFSIPSDNPLCLFVDKSGLLWIGSNGLGISRTRIDNESIRLLLPSSYDSLSLGASNVRFIKEMSNGEVWFAVLGHGVDVVDPSKNTKRSFLADKSDIGALQSSDIYAIDQDQDGDIWLISKSGSLYQYQNQTDNFARFDESDGVLIEDLYYLLALGSGDLLILGKGGAMIRSKDSAEFMSILPMKNGEILEDKNFYMASQLENGEVWLNGNKHLYLVSPGGREAEQITFRMQDMSPLPQGIIIGPMVGAKGEFYINKGGALLRQVGKASGGAVTLELIDPMFASQFNSIIAEDGNWWGYDHLIDGQSFKVVDFGRVDNVPMSFNWIVSKELSRSGTMLFGSPFGVVMIKPSLYEAPKHKPEPLVLSVSLDEQSFDYHDGHVLVPEYVKSISLTFFTPDYSAPELNVYAYRLLGYTEEWTEIDAVSRKTSFTNLAPGEYVFELRGSNRFGEWSDGIEEVLIIVEAKWFQTYWFRLFFLVAMLLIAYGAYRYRVQSLRRRGQELSQLVSERTQALETSLKVLKQLQAQLVLSEKMASLGRLVRGVAHQINTPLGIVKMAASNLSERLHLDGREGQHDKSTQVLRSTFELLEKNISRITSLVSNFKDIVPEVHSADIKRFEVFDAIKDCLRIAHKGLVNVEVQLCGDTTVIISGYKDGFITVITEIVTNATRHAWPTDFEGQKVLKISWYSDGKQLELCVLDNGCGIGVEFEEKIFDPFFTANGDATCMGLGLHKVYLLVSQQLGGLVEFRQTSSRGSEFRVQLPLMSTKELPVSSL